MKFKVSLSKGLKSNLINFMQNNEWKEKQCIVCITTIPRAPARSVAIPQRKGGELITHKTKEKAETKMFKFEDVLFSYTYCLKYTKFL